MEVLIDKRFQIKAHYNSLEEVINYNYVNLLER